MKLFRIWTEDKNREQVEQLVARYFDGFSIVAAVGYWKGTREASLCIEIVTDYPNGVRALARAIKSFNEQEAVLVQEIDCKGELV